MLLQRRLRLVRHISHDKNKTDIGGCVFCSHHFNDTVAIDLLVKASPYTVKKRTVARSLRLCVSALKMNCRIDVRVPCRVDW